MGQTASKGLSKAAEKLAKRAAEQRPPIPPRPSVGPTTITTSTSTTTTGAAAAATSSDDGPTTTSANPSSFLRGEGLAKQDVRDVGQERYLQYRHEKSMNTHNKSNPGTGEGVGNDDHQTGSQSFSAGITPPQSSSSTAGNDEMPADLLRFIQDVGPAKKVVDEDLTSPRLLDEANKDELAKGESARKASRRRRVHMPLVSGLGDGTGTDDGDEALMTQKNTNFAGQHDSMEGEEASSRGVANSAATDKEFSLDVVQFYELLQPSEDAKEISQKVDEFYQKLVEARSDSQVEWTEVERDEQKKLLLQTLQVLEVPTLRMDNDDNILGLYTKDVPGPEVKSMTLVPEDKAMLVLKDLMLNGGLDSPRSSDDAVRSLAARRRERKTAQAQST